MKENLSFLLKPASSDCNLFCDYCFYRKTASVSSTRRAEDYPETTTHRMTGETFTALARKAQDPERQAVSYMWQGGEPMLMGLDFFQRAMDIQEKHRAPNQIIANTIQTNGILINDEWAAFFAAHGFLVGISLDGPRDIHNLHRFTRQNRFVFDRVVAACSILKEHDVEFNILAVVTGDSAAYPLEIYRFLRGQEFHFLQFIDCMEVVDGEIAPFSVEPEAFGKFLCTLFDAWFEDGYPYVNIRLFDNLLQYHVGMVPECCMYKNDCGAYYVIEYNGDVFPCDFFVTRDWLLGNINEHSIEELRDNPKHIEFTRLRSIPHEKCESCPLVGFCERGCIKFRYWPSQDYRALNYMCEAYRTFYDYSKDRYRFLAWDIMRRRNGQPVPAIGRNDPCVCGSGRKYKKCCEKYSTLMKV